jgi:hypothetical protein
MTNKSTITINKLPRVIIYKLIVFVFLLVILQNNNKKMHGTCIEMIAGQQAKIFNNYKNTRLKLLEKNAAILFNKIRKTKQLTPK